MTAAVLSPPLLILACFALLTSRANSATHEFAVRLDYRSFLPSDEVPFEALSLVLSGGGAESIQYSPHQLTVVAHGRAQIDPARWSALVNASAQLEAKDAGPPGRGYEEGDPFYLQVLRSDGSVVELGGLFQSATPVLKRFITDLLDLARQLPARRLSYAYIRSQPIVQERFQRLREAGKTKFAALAEYPAALQPFIERAVSNPREFVPIERAVYDQLLPWCSQGREFFVLRDASASQCSLYSTKQRGPPQEADDAE